MWWWRTWGIWFVVAVLVMEIVVVTGREGSASHSLLMAQFIKSVRAEHFPLCTLVILEQAASASSHVIDEVTALRDLLLQQEASTPHLVFKLDRNLTQVLRDVDLNSVTRCPVYLTLSADASTVLDLFVNTEKDWDKYFMSRIHLVLLLGDTGFVEDQFLSTGEVNTMTNLLLVRPSGDAEFPYLLIQTNSPYDLPILHTLMTFRSGELKEGEGRGKDGEGKSANALSKDEGAGYNLAIGEHIKQSIKSIAIAEDMMQSDTSTQEREAGTRIDELSVPWNLLPDKLSDLHGFQMKVVTFHFPPRIFMLEQQNSEDYQLYGVDIEVVRALSQALNFSLSFTRPSDGEMWGWEQDNGTWTGLMGDLQTRKADLGVADLFIMEQYFSIIDMSVAYDIEYLCFVNPVPGPLPQWRAVTLPFLPETWLALLLSVLAGMVAFILVARVGFMCDSSIINTSESDFVEQMGNGCERTDVKGERKDDGRSPTDVWFLQASNACLLLYGCVMNEAWIRVPTSSHLRIFVLLWSLAFLIIAVAYKGSLVSHLTVPVQQSPIDTHKQLYDKGIEVGSIGVTLKRVMEKNADRFVRLLAERYTLVSSTTEGLKKTVEGSYSFLESRGFLDYTIAVHYTDGRGSPDLHVMREYIAPFGIGLAYPKFVPYVAKFNGVIRRLTEAGLAKKWMTDIILKSKLAKLGSGGAQKSEASETAEDRSLVRPLTLRDLQGGFILLGICYGLSALTFGIELGLKLCGGFFQ